MMRVIFALMLSFCLLPFSPTLAENESRLPAGIVGLEQGQDVPPNPDWLLNAKDDIERFRRIQIYAGGTYEQMWQIGYRYEQVYQAIVDKNWELARYHWSKLRDVFNVALMKRPRRTANAEALFLDSNWGHLYQTLQSGDAAASQRAFLTARSACMSCHIAEGMPFLNDTPIFLATASFR